MLRPRNETLAEALYRDIDKNEYLLEIYDALLINYSIKLYGLRSALVDVKIEDALRFADLLSKSTYAPTEDRDHLWGQEIATLLSLVYPEHEAVKYYLGSVLSAVGNYRGLKLKPLEGYQNVDVMDQIFYEYDKEVHRIPGRDTDYFFNDQLKAFNGLKYRYFSYSGPTSMGKSLVAQTFIKCEILAGSTKNYAILVPTKALINEVRSSIISTLQVKLKELNYRVVTAAGDLVLKQDHHFIFVMTPERLLHMMVERENSINVDFLFIDEAHKISERGGRSAYYYKVLSQIERSGSRPTVIFASPNIPNPEVYLDIVPGIQRSEIRKLASHFAPVCQFKYLIDTYSKKVSYYNDYSKELRQLCGMRKTLSLSEIIRRLGKDKQNLVYCSSKQKVIDYAVAYADGLAPSRDPVLIALAGEIRKEVHHKCYLADVIEKGVAYHVGYLPGNIRLRIEKEFENGHIRTIFCTSTLVEGVNLPADNLFITTYRDGNSNMDEVEFRNLVGRVGRIRYNLYGNVVFMRLDESTEPDKFVSLLQSNVPTQVLSIDMKENRKLFPKLIEDLSRGDVEMTESHEASTETDFSAVRKFALILTNDIAADRMTPVRQAFEPYLDQQKIADIRRNFPAEKTSDDITLSYDQADNLHDAIANGMVYPSLNGENDEVDFEELIAFLSALKRIFKWDVYEKETIGQTGKRNPDGALRRYAVVLLQWIRGRGLSTIIHSAIQYKEKHPETGIWSRNHPLIAYYQKGNVQHENYVIAETLDTIEGVLLFSISNYFRKFSLEYKAQHGVDHFENDWYEFVEYGTTNPLTIMLQQIGFSREVSTFIEEPGNQVQYLVEENGETKIRKAILTCGNIGVETEAGDIQYNMPELFVE